MNDPLLKTAAELWFNQQMFVRDGGYWLRDPERFSLRMTNVIQAYFGHGSAGRVAFARWAMEQYPVVRRITMCAEPGWVDMEAMRGEE